MQNFVEDITQNDFLNKLSFLENQIFNTKTKNLINNYQTWILIYLKKLFYDAVNQNYKYLQTDYKKFILKIYNFFELDKNKNILTSKMYKLFEESLNNKTLFENSKKFSENYYSKISWDEFLNKSNQNSEFNQDYFDNCHLPWNIEILKHKNSNNEFVLNIYADDDILLNLSDLVINKILTQDIFYKLIFQVNFYNSREKDFDYKKILNGNEPLINIITSKYELLIENLINIQENDFLNFLNLNEIFNCVENNSIGFDPMIQSLFEIHFEIIKKFFFEDFDFNPKLIPTKIKMLYVKKINSIADDFINDNDSACLFLLADKEIPLNMVLSFLNSSTEYLNKIQTLFGVYHFRKVILFDYNLFDLIQNFKKEFENREDLDLLVKDKLSKFKYSRFQDQKFLLDVLTSDEYEICGIYSNDLIKND